MSMMSSRHFSHGDIANLHLWISKKLQCLIVQMTSHAESLQCFERNNKIEEVRWRKNFPLDFLQINVSPYYLRATGHCLDKVNRI